MPELKDGAILSIDAIANQTFTYKGKEIKFEQDQNNSNVYTARTQLSQEEKEAGNLDTAFTFNAAAASGTVVAYQLPPEGPDFKNLTDSEKFTKLNSIAYQRNSQEPTDTGSGMDSVLERPNLTAQPQNKEELDKVLKTNKSKTAFGKQDEEDDRQKANKEITKEVKKS